MTCFLTLMPMPRDKAGVCYAIFAGRVWRHGETFAESICPWGEKASARRWTQFSRWAEFTPAFRMRQLVDSAAGVLPERHRNESLAASFILSRWPRQAIDALLPLPAPCWEPVQWANRQGQAYLDLLVSNPPLALLLAAHHRIGLAPGTDPASLLFAKRREILGAFGFPSEESSVRLLGRLHPSAWNLQGFTRLRDVLRAGKGNAARLAALPALTIPSLSILASPRLGSLVTPACLAKVSALDEASQIGFLRKLHSVARAAERFGIQLAAVASLRGLDDRCRQIKGMEEAERKAALMFPPAPLPPADGIEIIGDAAELANEGALMHHCCATFAGQARGGRVAFYRMIRPERATICIENRAGLWRLLDARGFCNQRLQPKTMARIEGWIDGSGAALEIRGKTPLRTEPPCFGEPIRPPRPRRRRANPDQLAFDFDAPAPTDEAPPRRFNPLQQVARFVAELRAG